MFKHVTPILMKIALTSIILIFVLSWAYRFPVWTSVSLAILISAVSYSVGDLFILNKGNNVLAMLADLFIATWIIWIIGPLIEGSHIPFSAALTTAVLIAAGEWLFHKYMFRYLRKETPI